MLTRGEREREKKFVCDACVCVKVRLIEDDFLFHISWYNAEPLSKDYNPSASFAA